MYKCLLVLSFERKSKSFILEKQNIVRGKPHGQRLHI